MTNRTHPSRTAHRNRRTALLLSILLTSLPSASIAQNSTDEPTEDPVINSTIDDEPRDDEWFLPDSISLHPFASGSSDDWGSNESSTSLPTPIHISNVLSLSAGNVHSVLLTNDGVILTAGAGNGTAWLGRDASAGFQHVTEVNVNSGQATTGPPVFVQVFASSYFTLGIDANGNVWSVGLNGDGQLCLNDTVDRDRFTMVDPSFYRENSFGMDNSTRIRDLALGERHTILIREDGRAFACGWNEYGQLGINTTGVHHSPIQIPLEGVVQAAGGQGSSYFLTEDGGVFATGTNYYGELCLGDRVNRVVPTSVGIADVLPIVGREEIVVGIVSGRSSLYMLLSDGTVWACGENSRGQLGDGETLSSSPTSVDVPIQVFGMDNVTALFSGPTSYSAYFVRGNGTVYAVGYNGGGQLGVGDEENRNIPTVVACSNTSEGALAEGIVISGGNDHALFLGSEPTFSCMDGGERTSNPAASMDTRMPTAVPTVTMSPTVSTVPTTFTSAPTEGTNQSYAPTFEFNETGSFAPYYVPTYAPSIASGVVDKEGEASGGEVIGTYSALLLFITMKLSFNSFISH